jgi:hypothetical protein
MTAPPEAPASGRGFSRTAIAVAVLPAVAVPLAFAVATWLPAWQVTAGAIAAVFLAAALWRVYRIIAASTYAAELAVARWHIWLHAVPAVFLVAVAQSYDSAEFRGALVALFAAFFYTGRGGWQTFARLFPDRKLYQLFLRGNSAFLLSFPVIYVASLIVPSLVSFTLIRNVALMYFSIHLTILGPSTLRIEADLRKPAGA